MIGAKWTLLIVVLMFVLCAVVARAPLPKMSLFYINMDSRPDRESNVLRQLTCLRTFCHHPTRVRGPPLGALGCSLGHISAVTRGMRTGQDFIVVEDDFVAADHPRLTTVLRDFRRLNMRWDVILLSANIISYEPMTDTIVRVTEAQTTGAYMVNIEYASTLLGNFKTGFAKFKETGQDSLYCVDQHWKLLQPEGFWFSFSPPVAHQDKGFSDIEQRYVDYVRVRRFDQARPSKKILIVKPWRGLLSVEESVESQILHFILRKDARDEFTYDWRNGVLTTRNYHTLYKFLEIFQRQFPDLQRIQWGHRVRRASTVVGLVNST